MSQLYRAVEIINGESTEPVCLVAVHPLRWHKIATGAPDIGLVEADDTNELREQRDDLLEACKAALTFMVILQNESSYDEPQRGDWPEVAKFRAAIAKAEGRDNA